MKALMLLFLLWQQVSSQTEAPINYLITPPTTYSGGIITDDCNLGDTRGLTNCPASARLTDNVTNEGTAFNENNFIGWSSSNGNVTLEFNFGSRSFYFTKVDIYFYNNPSAGNGLPAVSTAVSFSNQPGEDIRVLSAFTDNSDLTKADDNVDVASLIILVPSFGNIQFLKFVLDFSLYNITETFLSEIKFFTGTDQTIDNGPIKFLSTDMSVRFGPSTVQSSLQLSCTVTNNGTFSWSWSGPAVDKHKTQTLLADTSRTSILLISRLSADDNGVYTCTVEYSNAGPIPGGQNIIAHTTSSNISLTLNGSVITSSSGAEQIGGNATLQCIFTGYLPMNYEITWRQDGGPSLDEDMSGKYIINEDFNGMGESQNGGDMTESGIISELVVMSFNNSDFGNYTCRMNGSNLTATIQLITLSSTVSTMTTVSTVSVTSTPTPTPAPVDYTIIAVAVTLPLIVIIAIIAVAVIILIVYCKRRIGKATIRGSDSDDNLYSEVTKPAPPPLPSRALSSGYTMIDLPPSNGHAFPQFDVPGSPASFGKNSPKPAQISSRPDFLQTNPMYASTEKIDHPHSDRDITKSNSFANSIDSIDTLNIYAKPEIAPPVPPYRGTPDPEIESYTEEGSQGTTYTEEGFDPELFKSGMSSRSSSVLSGYYPIYADPKPLQRSHEKLLEVQERNIREIRELGMGQFGVVALSHTVGLSLKQLGFSDTSTETNVSLVVAIKRLKPEADDKMREAFEKEVKFMARLRHENVVRLLGVCLTSSNAFIMMEYMENGDLSHYLKDHDLIDFDVPQRPENTVTMPILTYMCLQIAKGMRYLASLHFIHRDLATRNILVGQDNKVKIADFGMSQNLYSDVYYRIQGRAMLPIRWMASECFYGHFSQKTDVWAFGILMWEVFTLCRHQPYEHMSDQEVIDDAVKREGRQLMSCPESCPSDVYDVMLECWVFPPDKRATFEQIHDMLSSIHAYNVNM